MATNYTIVTATSMAQLKIAVDAFLAGNPNWKPTGEPFYDPALSYSQAVYLGPAPIPPPPAPTSVVVNYLATQNIAQYDVVTSDGEVADSNIVNQRNTIIGISITNTLIGFIGQAVSEGEIQDPLWTWVVGDKIFLNGTTLSTVAPVSGFGLLIATATRPDTIVVEIQPSVRL